MKLLVLTLGCSLLSFHSIAQGWERIFANHNQEQSYTVCQTPDGDYLIGCVTQLGEGPNTDIFMIRLDADGNAVFRKPLVRPNTAENVSEMISLPDGGYLIAGSIKPDTEPPASDWNGYIVKLDANADTVWSREFPSVYNNGFFSVALTDDGGFILVGKLENPSKGWVVKTDSLGEIEWQHTYGQNTDRTNFTQVYPISGGYVISGTYSDTLLTGDNDCRITAIDPSGNILWQKTYGTPKNDRANSVFVDSNGDILVTSGWNGYTGLDSAHVLKMDASGNTLWTKSYVRGAGRKIIGTSDGNYLIAGEKGLYAEPDCYLLKIDPDGNELWSHDRGGSDYDRFYDVKEVDDGFIFAGMTDSYWFAFQMVYIVKTDLLGRLPSDLSTPFYQTEVDVKIGPNPFVSSISIEIDNLSDLPYQISIFDVQGRTVQSATISGGNMTLQRGDLASGTYSMVVSLDGQIIWQGKLIAE